MDDGCDNFDRLKAAQKKAFDIVSEALGVDEKSKNVSSARAERLRALDLYRRGIDCLTAGVALDISGLTENRVTIAQHIKDKMQANLADCSERVKELNVDLTPAVASNRPRRRKGHHTDGIPFYQRHARDLTVAERERLAQAGVCLHERRRYTAEEDDRIRKNWKRFAKKHQIPDDSASTFICHGTSLAGPEQKKTQRGVLKKNHLVAALCRKLPHRTGASVYRRARKLFDETHGVAPFTEDENRRLLELHRQHGENWLKISLRLGHSIVECRWQFDSLCGSGRFWTEEAKQRLTAAVLEKTGAHRVVDAAPSSEDDWGRIQRLVADPDTGKQPTASACEKQWLKVKRAAFGANQRLIRSQERRLVKRIKKQRPFSQATIDWTALAGNDPVTPLFADPLVIKHWFQQLKYRPQLRKIWSDYDLSFRRQLKLTHNYLRGVRAAAAAGRVAGGRKQPSDKPNAGVGRASHSLSPPPESISEAPPAHPTDFRTNHGENASAAQMLKARPLQGVDSKLANTILQNVLDERTDCSFRDISGQEAAKQALHETVILPLVNPEVFTGLREPVKGILLFGPPGNGKTFLAKAVATVSNCRFFNTSASTLTSKWVGEAEKLVKTLFDLARHLQPSIIFIDEIDSILCERSEKENESSRRLKTEFLMQFDGIGSGADDRILVMGATNRPFELDDAVTRRLPKRLYVSLPDRDARLAHFEKLMAKAGAAATGLLPVELEEIISETDGFSYSDLCQLAKQAAMGPVREVPPDQLAKMKADKLRPIDLKDFREALRRVKKSCNPKHLEKLKEYAVQYGEGVL